jgi:hypothetical protein
MASVIQVQYLVHQLDVGRFGLFQKNSKVVAQKVALSLDKSLYAIFINISQQCSGTISLVINCQCLHYVSANFD